MTTSNEANVVRGYSKPAGNGASWFTGVAASANIQHVGSSQFGVVVPFSAGEGAQASSVGVLHVLRARNPFKVFGTRVRLVAVLVVDLMLQAWPWRQETFSNKKVHAFVVSLARRNADSHSRVSLTDGRQQDPPYRPSGSQFMDGNSTNRSVPGHLVIGTTGNDTPFFHVITIPQEPNGA